jgi:hypothetical protein
MSSFGKRTGSFLFILAFCLLAPTLAIGQVSCDDPQCLDGDLCWEGPVTGATHSRVARSRTADFAGPSRMFTVDAAVLCNPDNEEPLPGEIFHYLVAGDTWGHGREVAGNHWHGLHRQGAVTTLGNRVGVVCHNCYYDENSNEGVDLDNTLNYIYAAQDAGADAIELDLKYGTGTGCSSPDIEVRHRDWEGPCLEDVLADPRFRGVPPPDEPEKQLLFIESKKQDPTESDLEDLLCLFLPEGVDASPTCDGIARYPEYAAADRPLMLRALWDRRDFITLAWNKLRQEPFSAIKDHVRLHLSFLDSQPASYSNMDLWAPYLDGFEFDYTDANLFAKIDYAKSLGMAVAVFGNTRYCTGDMFVASLREEVDYLIVEYPIELARDIIEEDNTLLYLNARDQFQPWSSVGDPGNVTALEYRDLDATVPKTLPINTSGAPSLAYWSRTMAEDLFGAVLDFDETQRLTFDDTGSRLDNLSCGGYLVAAVINHDGGLLSEDDIVSRAENSGFYLDIQGGVLRFGAHVGGSYHTAQMLETVLDGNNSYLIVGAYDGHGDPWLWVNDGQAATSSGTGPHGGVTRNNIPVLIGADPDSGGGAGQHFDGKIQRVSVLAWGNHPVPVDQPFRYHGGGSADCNQVSHLDVELSVNAAVPEAPTREEDADCPPGPATSPGGDVTYHYLVTNRHQGLEPYNMTDVTVTGSHGTPVYVSTTAPAAPPAPAKRPFRTPPRRPSTTATATTTIEFNRVRRSCVRINPVFSGNQL